MSFEVVSCSTQDVMGSSGPEACSWLGTPLKGHHIFNFVHHVSSTPFNTSLCFKVFQGVPRCSLRRGKPLSPSVQPHPGGSRSPRRWCFRPHGRPTVPVLPGDALAEARRRRRVGVGLSRESPSGLRRSLKCWFRRMPCWRKWMKMVIYGNLSKITDHHGSHTHTHRHKRSPNCGSENLKAKAPSCDCGELSPIGTMLWLDIRELDSQSSDSADCRERPFWSWLWRWGISLRSSPSKRGLSPADFQQSFWTWLRVVSKVSFNNCKLLVTSSSFLMTSPSGTGQNAMSCQKGKTLLSVPASLAECSWVLLAADSRPSNSAAAFSFCCLIRLFKRFSNAFFSSSRKWWLLKGVRSEAVFFASFFRSQ